MDIRQTIQLLNDATLFYTDTWKPSESARQAMMELKRLIEGASHLSNDFDSYKCVELLGIIRCSGYLEAYREELQAAVKDGNFRRVEFTEPRSPISFPSSPHPNPLQRLKLPPSRPKGSPKRAR